MKEFTFPYHDLFPSRRLIQLTGNFALYATQSDAAIHGPLITVKPDESGIYIVRKDYNSEFFVGFNKARVPTELSMTIGAVATRLDKQYDAGQRIHIAAFREPSATEPPLSITIEDQQQELIGLTVNDSSRILQRTVRAVEIITRIPVAE